MRSFKFGVQISRKPESFSEFCEIGRKAEDLGYFSVGIPDHLGGDQYSPIAGLTAMAMATRHITVGSFVLCNDFRHPLILAQEIATLNIISGGRVEVGVGAGWKDSDYVSSGIAKEKASIRIAKLEETLKILKLALSGSNFGFEGEYYRIEDASVPNEEGLARPRILVGGGGPKMLRLACKYGDVVGVNANLSAGSVGPELVAEVGPEAFEKRVDIVKSELGERISDVDIQALTFIVKIGDDADEFIDEMAPMFGVTGDVARSVPIVVTGSKDRVIEGLLERRERYGFNYFVVHDDELEQFAPMVEVLSGK